MEGKGHTAEKIARIVICLDDSSEDDEVFNNANALFSEMESQNSFSEMPSTSITLPNEAEMALYGDITSHSIHGSEAYNNAGENCAILGDHLGDFPENLSQILTGDNNRPQEVAPDAAVCTPATHNPLPHLEQINLGNQLTAFNQYYLVNILPTIAPPSTHNASGGTMFEGAEVTYMNGALPPPFPPFVHTFPTSYIMNSALAFSPTLHHPIAVQTVATEQYVNIQEMNYMDGTSVQVTTMGNTTNVYEQLVYAPMLQQQVHQMGQQDAAASAAANIPPDYSYPSWPNNVGCNCTERPCWRCGNNNFYGSP